ncbi:hypothetical protein [Pseudofrankia sp. BMG5.37]|uniref:hypothetical protein n=1 Tax=Pseudofrankia sp. BMG5.37 TaxID=3050035 RepID=UPI00289468D9|nr:hypothetical protein [Pseudofrankia sp. BMG5.37]MDT3445821.1 hypothetical protein [Pseudofrankia sp. BMG5.37]
MCAGADVALFFPIVYRIDVESIDDSRLDGSVGSGAVGSQEYLIEDLQEHEFDILFLESRDIDADMRSLAERNVTTSQALAILESRSR